MDQNNTAQTQPTPDTSLTSNEPSVENNNSKDSSKKFNTQTIVYIFLGIVVVALTGLVVYLFMNNSATRAELETTKEELSMSMEKVTTLEAEVVDMKTEMEAMETDKMAANYSTVMYSNEEYQKVGQVFQVLEASTVAGVEVQAKNADGNSINVYIAATTPEAATVENALASGTFTAESVVDEQTFIVEFTEVLELDANTDYFMWFETADEATTVDLATIDSTSDETGSLYMYEAAGGFSQEGSVWNSYEDRDLQYSFVENVF